MKKLIGATLLSLSLGLSTGAQSAQRWVDVEITNLTHGTYFTGLLFAAHGPDFHLYRLGTPASDELQAMAEGGTLTGLVGQVTAAGGHSVVDPAGGLLAPGATISDRLETDSRSRHLSIAAMLLPTNDGFVGLDALPIPRRPGVYTYYLNGYDAGTEANDELITGGGTPGEPGIPVDPGGNSGTGGTGVAGPDHNPTVHVHRGAVGDMSPNGGASDLDAGVHRWLNPVARLVLRVGPLRGR